MLNYATLTTQQYVEEFGDLTSKHKAGTLSAANAQHMDAIAKCFSGGFGASHGGV